MLLVSLLLLLLLVVLLSLWLSMWVLLLLKVPMDLVLPLASVAMVVVVAREGKVVAYVVEVVKVDKVVKVDTVELIPTMNIVVAVVVMSASSCDGVAGVVVGWGACHWHSWCH